MLTAGSQYVHFMSYQRVTLLLIGGYVQFSNDLGPSYMEWASPLDFKLGFKREDNAWASQLDFQLGFKREDNAWASPLCIYSLQ